jgi:sporulation protein YlmC with PRC-barrel domain/GNAT superfamily N-acetyltransferase
VHPFYLQAQFSDIKKGYEIFNHTNEKIGRIKDFVIDEKYYFTKVLLGHSLIETLKEKIGRKSDARYVIPIDLLERDERKGTNKLFLNSNQNQLKLITNPKALGKGEMLFSSLKNIKIFDSENKLVGRVIDAITHIDHKVSLILGGSYLEEIKEDLGIIPDLDIFLPTNLIVSLSSKRINISVEKSKLSKKATREDIQRGVQFDRYPGEKRHVFHRYEANIVDLEDSIAMLDDKIKTSELAKNMKIINLDHETLLEQFCTLYNEIVLASPDPIREITPEEARLFDEKSTFIVSIAGVHAGFIYLPLDYSQENCVIGAVAGIGVLGRYRRKRVGYVLLKKSMEFFIQNNVERVVCEIYEKNKPSQAMFESMGFKIYGHMVLEDEQ